MTRPFRFTPPAPPTRLLIRERIDRHLAERWDHRLTTVVAGPGFGKTSSLAAMLAADDETTTGFDVWLCCEPADIDGDHLLGDLAAAFGLGTVRGLDALLDAVWSHAPRRVCFVLDDVHEISVETAATELLTQLLDGLPGNGHLLLSSRDAVPVATARLAAAGELLRIREADLLLDDAELAEFARRRGMDPGVLASTGGWPALAELTASAGADLVVDYLWEEVLEGLGRVRAKDLARFAVVGGGGDDVALAVSDGRTGVLDLLDGVPLVQRTEAGPASLHELWTPPLRALLSSADADHARRRAAAAHLDAVRFSEATELLAEAGAWSEVLDVIKTAATGRVVRGSGADFGRWHRALPARFRQHPTAQLAAGLHLQARAPGDALSHLEAATAGFRAADDLDGEAAALAAHGLVLWWTNDVGGLLGLHQRALELAPRGSEGAQFLVDLGVASVAHLLGDSAGVFAALARADDVAAPGWRSAVHWLRSVAHRRDGDLDRAMDELDLAAGEAGEQPDITHARLRTAWLRGDVDEVTATYPELIRRFQENGDDFNAAGAVLELATKRAWLGDPDAARRLLADLVPVASDNPAPLAVVTRVLAEASIAVASGDDDAAAAVLHDDAVAMVGEPAGWYWRDRAAVALVHVLVPDSRPGWEREALGPPHRVGLVLAECLEGARDGDLTELGRLTWPPAGTLRAHLPLPWIAELAAAGRAAGNPMPPELIDTIGPGLRPAVLALVERTAIAPTVLDAARQLLAEQPALPDHDLHIGVLGPLEVRHDDEPLVHPNLRRQRVRELLGFLVARRRVRREEVTEELWPHLDDRGRNLRVTLSYLQRALEPGRPDGQPPYFLRADATWLALEERDGLSVDAWDLERLLDEADDAERRGAPGAALDAYVEAMPLWRGAPFADHPYASWAVPERIRLQTRYCRAAVRAGELLLASDSPAEARGAAQRAISADATMELGHQLLIRAHLADGDRTAASHALDACRAALADLDLHPSATTEALVAAG